MPGGQVNEAKTKISAEAEFPEPGSDAEENRGMKATLEQCLKDMAPLKRKSLGGGDGKGKKAKNTSTPKPKEEHEPTTEAGVEILNAC